MEDRLAPLRRGFRRRARLTRAWAALAYSWPRARLMALLALAPALLLVAAIALDPSGTGVEATRPENVEAVFARFIGAMATVATVAVAVASLVLGREMKGVSGQDDRHRANMEFRDDVREAAGRRVAPMSFGPFLSMALKVVARRAAQARQAASPEDLARRVEGVALREYLDFLEAEALRHARRADGERRRPHRLLTAALDFEQEVTHHLSRAFTRDEGLSPQAREAMERVSHALKDVVVATRYLKTLATQWGLSRMSSSVLVSTIPAVVSATAMVLLYDERPLQAWGVVPAGALVAAALVVVLLPLTAIVSHLLRFVFVNQRTLPSEDFVLGPERPDVAEDTVPSGLEGDARRRARSS